MRVVVALAILLLTGCARPDQRIEFSEGPDLPVQGAIVESISAFTDDFPDRTLVAWKILSNADTTSPVPKWQARTQVATFDHSAREWSSITTIDSLDGESPLLVAAADGMRLVMTRSLRTFLRRPDGSWEEGPGLTMPRSGLAGALAVARVADGQLGLAWDLAVPDTPGVEIWYQVCDSRFHPIRSERVIAGIQPSQSPGIGIGVMNAGRVWIVTGMDGGSDGVRTHLREGDGTWKELVSGTRPWREEPTLEVTDLAATSCGPLVWTAAAMGSLKLIGIPERGRGRIQEIPAGLLYPPVNPSARPLALACFSDAVGTAWIETREPTHEEGSSPGGLVPREAMYFDVRGISNSALSGRDSLVADQVSSIAMTSTTDEGRLWYGTGLLELPCRIGLRTARVR